MINTYYLELPVSLTCFHGSKVFEPLKFDCNYQVFLIFIGFLCFPVNLNSAML